MPCGRFRHECLEARQEPTMNPIARCTRTDLAVVTLCTVFLLLCLGAVSQTGRERAKNIVCQNNLRQLGLAQNAYLHDCDDRYPNPWLWLVKTESPVAGYQRYCRWHDPRYPPDGPLWPYLAKDKIVLCPTFNDLGSQSAPYHPSHMASYPIEPQYSYGTNGFLGGAAPSLWGASRHQARSLEARRKCLPSPRRTCGRESPA